MLEHVRVLVLGAEEQARALAQGPAAVAQGCALARVRAEEEPVRVKAQGQVVEAQARVLALDLVGVEEYSLVWAMAR